jgi:hypothetical protein
MKLTDTRADVLRLIAQGKHLGEYVPRYQPGKRRGKGAFPVTLAERAAKWLLQHGLVRRARGESLAYFRGSAFEPTDAGLASLKTTENVWTWLVTWTTGVMVGEARAAGERGIPVARTEVHAKTAAQAARKVMATIADEGGEIIEVEPTYEP